MLEAYLLSQEQEKNSHYSPLLFNPVLAVLASVIEQEKIIKEIRIRKEEIKVSLFTDDIVIYLEIQKNQWKNLL